MVAWLGKDMTEDPIGQPEPKGFRPVNPGVPVVEDYRNGPGRTFFERYFKLDNKEDEWPYPIKTEVLEARAERVGMVKAVCASSWLQLTLATE